MAMEIALSCTAEALRQHGSPVSLYISVIGGNVSHVTCQKYVHTYDTSRPASCFARLRVCIRLSSAHLSRGVMKQMKCPARLMLTITYRTKFVGLEFGAQITWGPCR